MICGKKIFANTNIPLPGVELIVIIIIVISCKRAIFADNREYRNACTPLSGNPLGAHTRVRITYNNRCECVGGKKAIMIREEPKCAKLAIERKINSGS